MAVAQGVANGLTDPLFEPMERLITDQLPTEKAAPLLRLCRHGSLAMNITSSESHPPQPAQSSFRSAKPGLKDLTIHGANLSCDN
jgi:hypothetical protein